MLLLLKEGQGFRSDVLDAGRAAHRRISGGGKHSRRNDKPEKAFRFHETLPFRQF